MKILKLVYPIFLVGLLLVLGACDRMNNNETNATINLLVIDDKMHSASVTGKELLWSNSEIKRKDSTGRIQFKARIEDADLLLIKGNSTYKTFRCYLEKGQTLNVVYSQHAYDVVGNSIAARQNRLLIKLDNKRKVLLANQSDTKAVLYENNLMVYNQIEDLISDFNNNNVDASPDFIRFVRFDNKYQYLTNQLDTFKLFSVIKKEWSTHDLKIYHSVIDDSYYPKAYFSESYRQLLSNYLIYLRFNDSQFLSNATSDPVKNEIYLASLLKCNELQSYQMAVSLKELLQNEYNLDLKYAINENVGYWKNFLLEVYNTVVSREDFSFKIEINQLDEINLQWLTTTGTAMNSDMYKGSWVFLMIGKNEYGYSPHETYFLDILTEEFPELKCFSIYLSKKNFKRDLYKNIQLVYVNEDDLKKTLKTNNLPVSLLINSQGRVEFVNLPLVSNGMLKPMLFNILKDK